MPTFTVIAYQEMFTAHVVEAESEEEARSVFITLLSEDKVIWQPSDEDFEIDEIVPADLAE